MHKCPEAWERYWTECVSTRSKTYRSLPFGYIMTQNEKNNVRFAHFGRNDPRTLNEEDYS